MLKLEDITKDAALSGIEPNQVVRVVTTEPVGDNALTVYYKTPDGRVLERMLFRTDEATLSLAEAGRPWAFDAPGAEFKLAAVSSLFETLVEKQAMTHNPTKGVERPARPSEKTPILPDDLMARLLNAPDETTTKGIRDRAMLSTFAHLALREAELASLRVGSYGMWDGVMQCKVEGKGDKLRYVEVDPGTQRRLEAYFAVVGHREDVDGPLFRPFTSGGSPIKNKHLTGRAIHKIIMAYAKATGIQEQVRRCNVHALRTTAANNARNNGAALDEVQKWMGHADISTTRKHYVHTGYLPENSPSFKVRYNGR